MGTRRLLGKTVGLSHSRERIPITVTHIQAVACLGLKSIRGIANRYII